MGRLISVTQVDANGDGTHWRAEHDGLGRRLVVSTYEVADFSAATRNLAYGPAPGEEALIYDENASDYEASHSWQGRRTDLAGFIWMGARVYAPDGGRFLSPDPLGHEASLSLYDYANGDPVNFIDPDGRLATKFIDRSSELKASSSVADNFLAMPYGLAGSILKVPGAIDYSFSEAGNRMAKARATINQYSGFQAVVGRVALMPADLSFGLSHLAYKPFDTLAGMPQGVYNLGANIGQDAYRLTENPSIHTVFDNFENATAVVGLILGGRTLAPNRVAARSEVTVYRVFGGDTRAEGYSWTTRDPQTVGNFRDAAGLPSGGASGASNTADFLIKGKVHRGDIIESRSALPLDGNKGGLPELIIDPKKSAKN